MTVAGERNPDVLFEGSGQEPVPRRGHETIRNDGIEDVRRVQT